MDRLKDGIQASLDADGWELESAVERQRLNPATFEIPSEAERTQLRVGDSAKLLVLLFEREPDPDGTHYVQCERVWVWVKLVEPTRYIGVLESRPISSDVLRPGDRIVFTSDHVAALIDGGERRHITASA